MRGGSRIKKDELGAEMEKNNRFLVFDVIVIVSGLIGGEAAVALFVPDGSLIFRVIAWLIGAAVVTVLMALIGLQFRGKS